MKVDVLGDARELHRDMEVSTLQQRYDDALTHIDLLKEDLVGRESQWWKEAVAEKDVVIQNKDLEILDLKNQLRHFANGQLAPAPLEEVLHHGRNPYPLFEKYDQDI